MYMWCPRHMQCSDNRGVCRYVYGVQGYIYMYETKSSGGMPPQVNSSF